MLYRWLATLLVIVHTAFVAFVVLGGFAVLRWRRVVWLHVPAVVWGVLIEFAGWACPLTPLENALRVRAGEAGYHTGFLAHYLLGLHYPAGLTRTVEWVLGSAALLVNLVIYRSVFARRRRVARAV